jgi:hypothetical protein
MDDKKLKNLDVLKTQIPELDENRLESIWNINPMALVLRVLVPRGMLLGALINLVNSSEARIPAQKTDW